MHVSRLRRDRDLVVPLATRKSGCGSTSSADAASKHSTRGTGAIPVDGEFFLVRWGVFLVLLPLHMRAKLPFFEHKLHVFLESGQFDLDPLWSIPENWHVFSFLLCLVSGFSSGEFC